MKVLYFKSNDWLEFVYWYNDDCYLSSTICRMWNIEPSLLDKETFEDLLLLDEFRRLVKLAQIKEELLKPL